MPFQVAQLSNDSIEDATAYWLYQSNRPSEVWTLVPGSVIVSRETIALRFTHEAETFGLVIAQNGEATTVKWDDRENPEREVTAAIFEARGAALLKCMYKDEIIFLHIEMAA